MKNVQIPYDLFVALVEYHLGYDDEYEDEIRQGLEQKLDALVRHELYAKYKTAPSAEEREQARQEYLDRRGVFPDFRWQQVFTFVLISRMKLAQKSIFSLLAWTGACHAPVTGGQGNLAGSTRSPHPPSPLENSQIWR